MKRRKVHPIRITVSCTVGNHFESGWRVIEELQEMSDGTERLWYRGISADLRDACNYGEQCPPLQVPA